MRGLMVAFLLAALACRPDAARPPAVPPPPPPAPIPGAVTKRLDFAILEDYDKGEPLDRVARDFAAFRALGITTWRGSFGWDDYEPAPGRYDFAWLERFVALARDSGLVLRPYLGYTPEWAAMGRRADGAAWNDPPRDLRRWRAFVHALATRLAPYPNVASYELYNEENTRQWWDGSAAEYNAVLAAGAEAVRAADPDAQVLLGGTVWPDAAWLEAACATHGNAGRIDVVPFHAYPETWFPDSVTVENYLEREYRASFLPTLRETCGARPVWINETGFPTMAGRDERLQARWWARAIATFAADSAVTHIGVYEIKDPPLTTRVIGDAPNFHLGLLRRDRSPKPAYHTVRLMVSLLAGELTVADRALGVTVTGGRAVALHAHAFLRPDGRQIVVVWDRQGAPTLRLTLPRAGGRARHRTLTGDSVPLALRAGRTLDDVRLAAGEPVIVEVTAPR